MKNKNGITLIALIITIIVLLILAGVSISLLTGENGVLNQAQNSSIETMKAKVKEELSMAWAVVDTKYFTALSNNHNEKRGNYYTKAELNEQLNGKGTIDEFIFQDGGVSVLKYTPTFGDMSYLASIDASGNVNIENLNEWKHIDSNMNGTMDLYEEVLNGEEVFFVIRRRGFSCNFIFKKSNRCKYIETK